MKYLFCLILLVLVAASIGTYVAMPDQQSDVPVIYWVTDANPARVEQVRKFHQWLVDNGHTKPGDPTRPIVELRLDTANRRSDKIIIQCVSGVGGDIMDVGSTAGLQLFYDEIGFLADVTEEAKKLKFDPGQTYEAIRSQITVPDGRGGRKQVMFPCNVYAVMLWVNRATFKKYGLEPPPKRWTFEQFERRGKRVRDVFFCNYVDTLLMHRSLGLSRFNETLTWCDLDDPRYVKVLKLKKKWMYEDRITPSPSDIASFATEAGYGGSTLQLFNSGNYAMFSMGRYALIQLRKFGRLELAVAELPHGGFPNTLTGTRAAAVYKGSKHKKLAYLFLAFLASESYNAQIVDDADALPPNPIYTKSKAFTRPAKYPNEWGCHEAFADAVEKISIGTVYSPFISPNTANREVGNFGDKFMSGVTSAEEAAADTARKINDEIRRTLEEKPGLAGRHEKLLQRQRQIDRRVEAWREVEALEAAGEPVPEALRRRARKIPLDWIDNVFYRRYYTHKGWAE